MLEGQDKITYVLFGATGNLAQIKIIPALCSLFEQSVLARDSKIITFGRREWGDKEYRDFIKPALSKFDEKVVASFLDRITFVNGTFDDPVSFEKLKLKIGTGEVFYHLAVLPDAYSSIIKGLGSAEHKGKLLIEKPFGNSVESAESLENLIENYFGENDILRIDHYLGKKGLKAIVEKRKTDPVFESKLNTEHVSRIVCRLREVIDIQGRGEFYDKVGAFIDVGQNHALELVATLLMELTEDQSDARKDVIGRLSFTQRSLIRAQYEGYKEEKGVAPESTTETYFRFGLQSNLPKFDGIEIVLEAGKALEKEERKEELEINFNDGENFVFNIDIPKHYNAYETVIEAALKGDKDTFVGKNEILALWRLADEVRENMSNTPLVFYKKGNGPQFTN
ncbi:MAG: Glucose-6-phosphate 1-dehydrogenase [Candidatus Taylorbacteria bacterium]|nr:Glucose-6-phosphate 1-dehydrogenase [Candidatus Taylorbacteria bacterium]